MPTAGVIFLLFEQGSGVIVIRRRGGHGGGPTRLKPRGWWDEEKPWWHKEPVMDVRTPIMERRRQEAQEREFRRMEEQAIRDAEEADRREREEVSLAISRHQSEIELREKGLEEFTKDLRAVPAGLFELEEEHKRLDEQKLSRRVKMARLRARKK